MRALRSLRELWRRLQSSAEVVLPEAVGHRVSRWDAARPLGHSGHEGCLTTPGEDIMTLDTGLFSNYRARKHF